jgi:hypothetical protein
MQVFWEMQPCRLLICNNISEYHTAQRWMDNQHLVLWRGPCRTQRQTRELISGPSLTTTARLLSFSRTQSRVVTGLLTGHNALRRHLYVMGLSNNPTCRKCGTEKETSVHILCECEALVSLRHAHLGSFFVDPEGPSGTLVKEQSFFNLAIDHGAQRACFKA